jgi:hypothetical protein
MTLHLDPTSSGRMYTGHTESGRGGEGDIEMIDSAHIYPRDFTWRLTKLG